MRSALLRELIRLEVEYRRRAWEELTHEEYSTRFRELENLSRKDRAVVIRIIDALLAPLSADLGGSTVETLSQIYPVKPAGE